MPDRGHTHHDILQFFGLDRRWYRTWGGHVADDQLREINHGKTLQGGDHVFWNSEAGRVKSRIVKVHVKNVRRHGAVPAGLGARHAKNACEWPQRNDHTGQEFRDFLALAALIFQRLGC
jgi:hypothetical protein